jgi:ribonucleoside-triphosphate reductase (thioredoxin)
MGGELYTTSPTSLFIGSENCSGKVGTGFDVKGANKLRILEPLDVITDVGIPDTREGWVKSLKSLLNAFFEPNSELPLFDYSLIRPKGELIKTFGGKSSGADPLIKLHEQIKDLLYLRVGDYLSATDITDIMNMIGVCVVSGNVRRTAQIVFGDYNDEEYLKLKDYKWDSDANSYIGSNSKRAEWGWASNNSIFAEIGMDYSEVAKQTASNGEPGYAWLENMKNYSRMNNDPDYIDHRVKGGNPLT